MSFMSGTPEKFDRISNLDPQQSGLYNQLLQAGKGSFGGASNYYKSLLSDNNSTFDAYAAPEMRQFREQTIPDLSEQFAGMGAGGLSSSGFRNAAVNAGTDLSERLGAIRAQLRQQGAQGLMGIGQQGMQSYGENIYRPAQPGFGQQMAPAIGMGIGALAGSFLPGAGTAMGASLGNQVGSLFSGQAGSSSPYGARS